MNIPNQLIEAVKNDKLVIFAGSGLSRKFELPSWDQLAYDVIDELNDLKFIPLKNLLKDQIMSPREVLDKLDTHHNIVKRHIKKNFKLDNTDKDLSLHLKLIELSGKIITTNYDNAFELSCDNSLTVAVPNDSFNVSEINKHEEKFIFKIHGTCEQPDTCIVFSKQYNELYKTESATKQKLSSIFSEKTILFLGFSFNDWEINSLFNSLDISFDNNNKHFILTPSPRDFNSFNFLTPIEISSHNEIEFFIDNCLNAKLINKIELPKESVLNQVPKIAVLSPNPIDIDKLIDLNSILDCFNSIHVDLYLGTLNLRTLGLIEDFDLVVIITKQFKGKLYIEDNDLRSNLIEPKEIFEFIPNDEIPILFISDTEIKETPQNKYAFISTFKTPIIKKFVFKSLREGKFNFIETEINIKFDKILTKKAEKGAPNIHSIYGNDKNLNIGKKSLMGVVGRIEEQAIIAQKLINIIKSNKVLNIKASGGLGKTTLIKKVSHELYNRGYFKEGINFKSCENIKSYNDFEEILVSGFNLTNIIDFKDYLIQNYSQKKCDLLLILDNFETIVNELDSEDYNQAIEILKFATDYTNIAITSRESIASLDGFEDLYSLGPLTTDDAVKLFIQDYGKVLDSEVKILRQEILEELLNNNPLAIKLITKSRINNVHISDLKTELENNFFESVNEDYNLVFSNDVDLNIERTKSIYHSINYSFSTLNSREKTAFELLSLFPDGISLSNFKNCFSNGKSKNKISDLELRVLRNKSLIEDYNGILQLQPIIRRFADFQFNKKSKEDKRVYATDAYLFNDFILDLIDLIRRKTTFSEALKKYYHHKNNLLTVLDYFKDINLEHEGVSGKEYLLDYVYRLDDYIVSNKQVAEFNFKIDKLMDFFSDVHDGNILLKVLALNNNYFNKEFDQSYKDLSAIMSAEEMLDRSVKDEKNVSRQYRNVISNVHSMEGYTFNWLISIVKNESYQTHFDNHYFYLGLNDNVSRNKESFYFFEYELMFNRLKMRDLEKYISNLHVEHHLEIMQSTYTLSKVKTLDKKTINKLVITNPYTRGLKELMLAFCSKINAEKSNHFKNAIKYLTHIKYYHLEARYYLCLFLKETNSSEFENQLEQGLLMCNRFKYQYLSHQFNNLKNGIVNSYNFSYEYYDIDGLESFVTKHNSESKKMLNGTYWED